MARLALLAASAVATLLLFATAGMAAPPTRVSFDIDATFLSPFLSAACGIPVYVHQEGTVTVALYYDASGTQVIRELDTVPGGLTITRFSPIELGGTGKAITGVEHASFKFLYPEGTDIGDPAILIITGVQRTSGPGNPRFVGHEVDEGVIIDVTPEGIPLVDIVAIISQSGNFPDPVTFFQALCDALTDP